MEQPRRLADGLAVLDTAMPLDDRTRAVLGAMRVLEALSPCGDSWHLGDGDRTVHVVVSCGRAECPVCRLGTS